MPPSFISFFALSAAPKDGMFKKKKIPISYQLQLAGAVCEKHNTGYVMRVQESGVEGRVGGGGGLLFHCTGDPAE